MSGADSSFFDIGNVAEPAIKPAPSTGAVNITVILLDREALITSPLEFSTLQIVVCIVLVSCREYLQTMIDTRLSFTTLTEHRAVMVHCLSSRFFDWSSRCSGYLANGRWIRGINGSRQLFDDDVMQVKELPTLAIVPDLEESERANASVLRSTIPSKLLCLNRVFEAKVYEPYEPDSDREVLLSAETGRTELREQDVVI